MGFMVSGRCGCGYAAKGLPVGVGMRDARGKWLAAKAACSPQGRLFEPVEAIMKGNEATLPARATFRDKDGHERSTTTSRR